MGIKDLAKVVADHASKAVREGEIKEFFGRKVALDASLSMYQFLIAVRQDGVPLVNDKGETTSHLNGLFYRTIRMMDNGIKPVYVFDGKPPEMKSDELAKRRERRDETRKELETARETGDTERVHKLERRMVTVTPEQTEGAKALLRAMGLPVVEAPAEAEAMCAELVQKGKVYATGTEDMDALTFGSSILLRHLTFSEAKKVPIKEYTLEKILTGFEMDKAQFIDLCILLGCDYCETIKGIGPKKAFELITKYKSIESILENIDTERYVPPKEWRYAEARAQFTKPEVTDGNNIELTWTDPDEEALKRIMVTENGFADQQYDYSEERIKNALVRLKNTRGKAQQGRIDCFFAPIATQSTEPSAKKRAAADSGKAKAATSSNKARAASNAKAKKRKADAEDEKKTVSKKSKKVKTEEAASEGEEENKPAPKGKKAKAEKQKATKAKVVKVEAEPAKARKVARIESSDDDE